LEVENRDIGNTRQCSVGGSIGHSSSNNVLEVC